MTFDQFQKNVEKIYTVIPVSSTEFIMIHILSFQESRQVMGHIFQPYQSIEERHVPSFLFVCANANASDCAKRLKKKGLSVLDHSKVKLPSKKDTASFIEAILKTTDFYFPVR